jgi:hypothetical protein
VAATAALLAASLGVAPPVRAQPGERLTLEEAIGRALKGWPVATWSSVNASWR